EIARQIDEGNPRRLLALARAARVTGTSPAEQQEAMARRQVEIAKLGRPATMLMSELESLGPASASDERLLQRLGWTRSRAVQVFRELEDSGFVTASYVRGPAGGRPKVYRPTDRREPQRATGRRSRSRSCGLSTLLGCSRGPPPSLSTSTSTLAL